MDLFLKDKVFLVAASSKGLGFGIAEALAKEGAKLSLASRSKSEIESAANDLKKRYAVDARGYVLDVTQKKSIDAWVQQSIKDLGEPEGLVVNAGGPPLGKFEEFDDQNWQNAFELTLMSAVRMIRAVIPSLLKRNRGSVLAITSTSVKEPSDMLLLSNVLRAGVANLIKSLANEYAPRGIRFNSIIPGRIDTERVQAIDKINAEKKGLNFEELQKSQQAAIPLGRYGTVGDFGAAAAFLLSEAASYITGISLVVDGGKLKTGI